MILRGCSRDHVDRARAQPAGCLGILCAADLSGAGIERQLNRAVAELDDLASQQARGHLRGACRRSSSRWWTRGLRRRRAPRSARAGGGDAKICGSSSSRPSQSRPISRMSRMTRWSGVRPGSRTTTVGSTTSNMFALSQAEVVGAEIPGWVSDTEIVSHVGMAITARRPSPPPIAANRPSAGKERRHAHVRG